MPLENLHEFLGDPYNLGMHSMMPHYVVSTLHCNCFENNHPYVSSIPLEINDLFMYIVM